MSKYHSRKVTVNGITYDSKKEAYRHQELLLLERSGAISHLQRQVEFELIPAQREPDVPGKRGGIVKRGKIVERKCSYVADFVYTEDGRTVVEDVKGYKQGTAYDVFVIKRKLMLFVYGIRIREV